MVENYRQQVNPNVMRDALQSLNSEFAGGGGQRA